MLKQRIFCLLLSLSLLTGPAARAVKWEYPASAHPDVDYTSMLPATGFDETALQAALKELTGICARHSRQRDDKESRRQAQALYAQILEEMNTLVTKTNLSSIQYDASGAAPEEASLYLELSAQQTRLFDQCYRVLGLLAASPYQNILDDSAGKGTARSLLDYEGITEEDSALYEEEDLLVQAYDQIMSVGVPAMAEGQVWTLEALETAELDAGTYEAVSEALQKEQTQAAGEIYSQLVHLRTEIASRAGYDSYTEYAYEVLYSRDYEPEDIRSLREAAKKHLLPLQLRLLEELSDQDLRALDVRSRSSGEEILDRIQPFIQGFDNEMGETFAFMREHGLYDIEYDNAKLLTGYTVALPAYGSAFIFNSPYGDYRDYSDTVHEFGHFNETFHGTQHSLWSDFTIDVGEIHSQALELMFTTYAAEIFGERYGNVYAGTVLYNILDSILDGCLYDEFQAAVYENPDMDVSELNRLFKSLSEEYGYFYDTGIEEDASWIENSHNFQSPFYFISYATSALSSLDLWFLYLDHPQQAKRIYLDLTTVSLPYREAIEHAGLRDIFDPETVPLLAETLESCLDGEDVSYGRAQTGRSLGHVVIGAFGLAALTVILALRARPSKRERAAARRREALEPWSFQENRENPRRDGPDPWSVRGKKPPWEL